MFRNGATRSLLRTLNAQPTLRTTQSAFRPQLRSQLCTLSSRRPQALAVGKPLALQLMRAQASSTRGPMDTIDRKHEQSIAKQKLEIDPEHVSSTSSIHPVLGEVKSEETGERETEMLAGVKSDLVRALSVVMHRSRLLTWT